MYYSSSNEFVNQQQDPVESNSGEEEEITKMTLWQSILQESEENMISYRNWEKEQMSKIENQIGVSEYLNKEVFPVLLPAMENMLEEANRQGAFHVPKCRFNGLDYLAEIIWNRNPRHPARLSNWLDVFSIPKFKLLLRLNPRPIFPKSWLWSKSEAALQIQRYVRGWLVRKREDVQEMRQFWKAISIEPGEFATLEQIEKSVKASNSQTIRYCNPK